MAITSRLKGVRCPVRFICSHVGCRRLMPGTVQVGVNETEEAIMGIAAPAPGWVLVQDADNPGRWVLFCEHHSWLAHRTTVSPS